MHAYHTAPDTQPMMEMNTTPLIDVMLVLLIMFIITIPIQTHGVNVDLPGVTPPAEVKPVKNKVVVTAEGQILWNGTPLGLNELRTELTAMQRMVPQPELQLQPDPDARYLIVDQVLAETKRADVTSMGFVGNERYAAF